MRIRLVAPALAAGALVLAACGGGSDSSSDAPDAPLEADVTVIAVDPLAWDKPDYTASAGEIVIATVNDSSQPHNLRIIGPDGGELPVALDIPSNGDQDSTSVTIDAGAYTLICTIPGHTNMKSTLTVS